MEPFFISILLSSRKSHSIQWFSQLHGDIEVGFRATHQRYPAGVILIMSVDMTQRGAVRNHQQVRMVKVRRGFGDLSKLDRPLQQLEAFTALKALQRGKGIAVSPGIIGGA